MTTVYIYGLIDPRTKEIMYVGKTKNVEYRFGQHISLAQNKDKSARGIWIRELLGNGQMPELTIIDTCDPSEWREREHYWITRHRSVNPNLKNGASGRGHTRQNDSKNPVSEKTGFQWRLRQLLGEYQRENGISLSHTDINQATKISPNTLSMMATNKARAFNLNTMNVLLNYLSIRLGRRLQISDLLVYFPDEPPTTPARRRKGE